MRNLLQLFSPAVVVVDGVVVLVIFVVDSAEREHRLHRDLKAWHISLKKSLLLLVVVQNLMVNRNFRKVHIFCIRREHQ